MKIKMVNNLNSLKVVDSIYIHGSKEFRACIVLA